MKLFCFNFYNKIKHARFIICHFQFYFCHDNNQWKKTNRISNKNFKLNCWCKNARVCQTLKIWYQYHIGWCWYWIFQHPLENRKIIHAKVTCTLFRFSTNMKFKLIYSLNVKRFWFYCTRIWISVHGAVHGWENERKKEKERRRIRH